jgi:hypothetical protein
MVFMVLSVNIGKPSPLVQLVKKDEYVRLHSHLDQLASIKLVYALQKIHLDPGR